MSREKSEAPTIARAREGVRTYRVTEAEQHEAERRARFEAWYQSRLDEISDADRVKSGEMTTEEWDNKWRPRR